MSGRDKSNKAENENLFCLESSRKGNHRIALAAEQSKAETGSRRGRQDKTLRKRQNALETRWKKTKHGRWSYDFWPRNGSVMEYGTLIQFVPGETPNCPFVKWAIVDYNELALGGRKIMSSEDWRRK